MDDFVNAIEYEVKQEIANRYFGFRSQIETEKRQHMERLYQADRDHLEKIRLDLHRLRILLHRKRLFEDLLVLVKLPKNLIAIDGQPPISNLFNGLRGEGFSRWWRYCNLAGQIYRSLEKHIAEYRNTWLDLVDEHAEICSSIDTFHRNNDLSGILNFLKTFNSADNERLKFLHTQGRLSQDGSLDQDLRISHPRPVTNILPELPALPPLKQMKGRLKELLKASFSFHASQETMLPF